MSHLTTKRLIEAGFLASNFEEELIKDYYEEYFGGLYEDLFIDGVELYFPKCQWNEVAFIHTNLHYEDLKISSLKKLLHAFQLPVAKDLKRMDYKQAMQGRGTFEAVLNGGSTNFLGRHEGLVWCIYLNPDGTLLQLEAHDVELIQANDEDRDPDPVPLLNRLKKKLMTSIQL